MYNHRIKHPSLLDKIITAPQAAAYIQNNTVVGSSGFTQSGDSKAVLPALAERAATDPLQITLITGASLGHGTDGLLANAHVLKRRLPFQVDPTLRKDINKGEVLFIDQHLSETAEQLKSGHFPEMDIAILEAAMIEDDGSIIPTTSVGNSAAFAQLANKIIIELNMSVHPNVKGIHDIFFTGNFPNHRIIPITRPDMRIGYHSIPVDPDKVIGIVITNEKDSPADIAPPDTCTTAIAGHLLQFFDDEIKKGRLTRSLLPLQCGIGKVANAVLSGLLDSDYENLTMYSEVLQDSTFDLIDAGKMRYASGSSITVSEAYYEKIFNNIDHYKQHMVLRPQDISNAAEVIRRLGVIAVNTALECDIYGNVNSTHVSGTHMMNGIGGSGDFARNAYLSIFVTSSTAKHNDVSCIVPMVSHVDHSEHDVDVIITENGLADLRNLAPRERARLMIEHCTHGDYKEELMDYFKQACKAGGQTPHLLHKAFSWHTRFKNTGSMKSDVLQPEIY
ncbi:acetyl-CoA hydrolase/succinyl-CoA:acetate CoA-transferase [Filimonas lacunae]|uniref:Acetyl-CoA hydrolase/succinyl-CoA:acetate CoA-transferase n=1 Tax=Filimonas lacunae TaxID=477680 RepID=A0A173MER2_9BACT|nr:succinate CoA transferase [Filimonas lacunae]BAV06093.1 acetyl-CoA hydrolase [Filimonas lacunae]SIT24617.1 acetyl-CoA hydrolase/succinyl-CoA:acetate CoA-transferase [Filimonas lacunae]